MQEVTTFLSNHFALSVATVVTLVLLSIIEVLRLKRTSAQLTPGRLTQLINHEDAAVIDIRSNDVFKKGHITDAVSLPAAELKENAKKLEKYKTKPVIIICENGLESQKIAAQLGQQGYNVHSLAGGLRTWRDAQLPLIKE